MNDKELKDAITQDAEILKINCDLLLKTFDKLDPDSRFKEFAKMAIAYSIIRKVMDMVREIGEEAFLKVLDNDFVKEVFSAIGTFNTVGVELGYTTKIKDK